MPSKRAERAAGSTDASTEVPESTETIEERHAHLITAEQAQPRLAEIEEMERELREGSSPARGRASAGMSPAPEIGAWVARRAMALPVFRASLFESCEISSRSSIEESGAERGPND